MDSFLCRMAPITTNYQLEWHQLLKSAKNIIEKNGKKNDEIKILHIAICFVIILFGIM